VRRLDGDDPYLVVAADKGTAHLSDTANEIAQQRDFWLGDAFASGGSEGYDHKRYAITARGAWECVKHHLAELGIDPESEEYEVAGIGDMSGDVFGNGLLLMPRAKLVAAFDHRHVFLDPDPDPATAHAERKRLFELDRSSWADYSQEALSEGGGVWPRTAKTIPIPRAMRTRLGLGEHASGQDVVRSILTLDVDLLWNGGIGTYVRASHETDGEVGDRANDAVRIEARQLRTRIVGEGGNLGLTQAARVEAAMHGVLLDTDAIHNSAGVDLSDHEVNYKIALAPLVRSGRLDRDERRKLLFEVADEACEAVLAHNRGQALSISLDAIRSRIDPEAFAYAIASLREHAGLSESSLGLPDAEAVRARAAEGGGLWRPELAVLLGLAKNQVQAALQDAEFTSAPYLEPILRGYFPGRFREAWPDALDAHPLRTEITALCLSNHLVDAGGATLFTSLEAELGADARTTASALLMAEDMMQARDARERVTREWTNRRSALYETLIQIDDGVRMVARFLVKCGLAGLDRDRAERWRDALDSLLMGLHGFLARRELRQLEKRRDGLRSRGLSDDLAERVACLPLADRGLNILRVVEKTATPILSVAPVYTHLGEAVGLDWLYERLAFVHTGTYWDRIILADLRQNMLDLQRALIEHVLARDPAEPMAAAEAFLAEREHEVARILELQQRAAGSATPSALMAIAARCERLRPTRSTEPSASS
jgi:glutamate dehydrogenase